MVKEYYTKMEGVSKPKGRLFQKSTPKQNAVFKVPASGLEYK